MAEEDEGRRLLSYLKERFGIPADVFHEFILFRKKTSWWLLKKSPCLETACRLKVSSFGMRAFNQVGHFIKPTTRMIQLFGKTATRARLDITEEALQRLVAGEALAADLAVENGYVILCREGHPLGLGLLIDGRVRSQLPQKELKFINA